MLHRNVLVVDDDPEFRGLLESYLVPSGFVVKGMPDGYSAMEELSLNHYDLMILDITMPHWNGFRVLKAVRDSDRFKHLPIIMLTANDAKDYLLRVCSDVSDYMLKPPRREDLLTRIERILGGRPQFEEIQFLETGPWTEGTISVPVRLVSISIYGIILSSTVPLPINLPLDSLKLGLFEHLRINPTRLNIKNAIAGPDDKFEHFIPFLGLTEVEQKRVRDWIRTESYRRRRSA